MTTSVLIFLSCAAAYILLANAALFHEHEGSKRSSFVTNHHDDQQEQSSLDGTSKAKKLLKNNVEAVFKSFYNSDNSASVAAARNASALFQLGLERYQGEQWQEAYDFFMASWKAYNKTRELNATTLSTLVDDDGYIIGELDILDYAQYTAFKLGNVAQALALCFHVLSHAVDGQDVSSFEKLGEFYYRQLANEQLIKEAESLLATDDYKFCRDENVVPHMEKMASSPIAICRLSNRGRHPLLILSPVKEEILSRRPFIALFHDIIRPHEIATIKYFTKSKLQDSNVVSLDTYKTNVEQKYRKAQTAWLANSQVHGQLTKRIEAITGLNAKNPDGAEFYQITRYGISGHNIPHYDVLPNTAMTTATGDRIATLLIYLSDVESGGETVFTKLKLRVTPELGAGLFWHNCHQNETHDERTLHAACPVQRGEKWVTNKWFRYRGQLLHRPCCVKSDQSFNEHSLRLPASLKFP